MKTTQTAISALALGLTLGTATAEPPPTESDSQSKTNASTTALPEVTVRERKEDPIAYAVLDATTGTKTDTPIMETPVSVQVVPQQVIKDQNLQSISEAMKNVSGVTPGSSGGFGDDFYIRGFEEGNNIYEDGARYSYGAAAGLKRDLANVERIEVLKGPASILYGQGEPGGLVNTITKKPLDYAYYALEQEFGSFASYRTTVDATGPVNQDGTLLYRANLAYVNADSFRDFVETERVNVYPTLQWKISPQTQVTMELHYGHGFEYQFDTGIPFINGQRAQIPRSRNLAEPDTNGNTVDDYSGRLGWSHNFNEDWTFRQYFKYEHVDSMKNAVVVYPFGEPDAIGEQLRDWYMFDYNNATTYNTAIDLTGKFATWKINHTVLVGTDYYNLTERYAVGYGFGENGRSVYPPINIYNPVYGQLPPPRDPSLDYTVDHTPQAYGIYAQDQLEIPQHIFLLAGLRFDRAQDDDHLTDKTVKDKPPVTPRLGLLWQPVPQLSLYTSYTENFGLSSFGILTYDRQPLPNESAQQFEVGVKTELFDKRLTGTMSVYDLTKQNVLAPDPVYGDPFYVALGEVRSRGFEMDINGAITPGWNIIATYSYINAQTTVDQNGLPGGRTAGVPHNSGSLWMTYALKGSLSGLKLGGGVVARSSQVDYLNNTISGYATLNLFGSYSWRVGQSMVTAQLNIVNLLDSTYYTSTDNIPGAPLSALGTIRVTF